MLTILADMLMTASGQAHKETGRQKPMRGSDHWAGRTTAPGKRDRSRAFHPYGMQRDL